MSTKVIFMICLSCILGISAASAVDTGGTAYSFLKVGMNAKSQAMAGAYTGLADDLGSLKDNPAGLSAATYDIKKLDLFYDDDFGDDDDYGTSSVEASLREISQNRFQATYLDYLIDFQAGFLGYARKINESTSLGASIEYMDFGSFEGLDQNGISTGSFSAYDMAFGLTYSKRLNNQFALGVTGKFIFEHIADSTSDAMALDIGAIYRLKDRRTSFGLVFSNLGAQLKGMTKAHKDPLPIIAEAGFSHSLKGMPLTVNADLTIPNDNDASIAFGGQYEKFKPFLLRLGWSSSGSDHKTGSSKDDFGGFAGGFGYAYRSYNIDYAYSSFADIGNVHRVTLGANF